MCEIGGFLKKACVDHMTFNSYILFYFKRSDFYLPAGISGFSLLQSNPEQILPNWFVFLSEEPCDWRHINLTALSLGFLTCSIGTEMLTCRVVAGVRNNVCEAPRITFGLW